MRYCYYYYYCHLACFTVIGPKGLIPLSCYGYPTPNSAITQKNKTLRYNTTTSSLAWIGNTNLRNRNPSNLHKLNFVGGSSRSSVADAQDDSRNYFLLNSKRIWRQIMFNTIILFVMKYIVTRFISPVALSCCNRHDISFSFMKHFSNINVLSRTTATATIVKAFTDLFLPLMSSACCAIQLILNSIGVGCAGFNTVLGPLRPYFVATLLFKSIEMFTSTQTIHVVKFIGAWFLALLPEIIHFMNHSRASKTRVLFNDECYYSYDVKRILVTLNIPSMGCVACINKIDATIQNLEHVVTGSSKLNNIGKGGSGTVLLECSNDADVGTITQKLVQSVTDAGFPCEVDGISVQE